MTVQKARQLAAFVSTKHSPHDVSTHFVLRNVLGANAARASLVCHADDHVSLSLSVCGCRLCLGALPARHCLLLRGRKSEAARRQCTYPPVSPHMSRSHARPQVAVTHHQQLSLAAVAASISILALVALFIVVPAVRATPLSLAYHHPCRCTPRGSQPAQVRGAQRKQDTIVDLFITVPGQALHASYLKLMLRCGREGKGGGGRGPCLWCVREGGVHGRGDDRCRVWRRKCACGSQ